MLSFDKFLINFGTKYNQFQENDFIKWHKSEQKTQVFSTDVLPNGVSVVEGSNEPIDSSPNQKLRLHVESL
mgnify:CR=1 FL=1